MDIERWRGRPFLFLLVVVPASLLLLLQVSPSARVAHLLNSSVDRLNANGRECRWVFDRYEASEYETLWTNNVKQWQSGVCQKVVEPVHSQRSEDIVKAVLHLKDLLKAITFSSEDSAPMGMIDSTLYDAMSRMHYRRECQSNGRWVAAPGQGAQLIEPLWAYLRDPFDIYCKEQALSSPSIQATDRGQSKNHILPQGYAPYAYTTSDGDLGFKTWRMYGRPPWQSAHRAVADVTDLYEPPRNVFLDLGSSLFGKWHNKVAAASGLWTYNTYHERGTKFDRFIAVEAERLDPAEAYRSIPDDLVPAYTLMNVYLTMDGGKLDASNLIRNLVHREDFFVLKLDIDSASIEYPLATALLEDHDLASLVDELYFEDHVDLEPLRNSWGHSLPRNLADSYDMFQGLRRNGIRAHSWP